LSSRRGESSSIVPEVDDAETGGDVLTAAAKTLQKLERLLCAFELCPDPRVTVID
jgi:hypothetical protein